MFAVYCSLSGLIICHCESWHTHQSIRAKLTFLKSMNPPYQKTSKAKVQRIPKKIQTKNFQIFSFHIYIYKIFFKPTKISKKFSTSQKNSKQKFKKHTKFQKIQTKIQHKTPKFPKKFSLKHTKFKPKFNKTPKIPQKKFHKKFKKPYKLLSFMHDIVAINERENSLKYT